MTIDEFFDVARTRLKLLQEKAAENALLGNQAAAASCAAGAGEIAALLELRQHLAK